MSQLDVVFTSEAPPKSWRRNAKAEGPFSARCEMPPDVVVLSSGSLDRWWQLKYFCDFHPKIWGNDTI